MTNTERTDKLVRTKTGSKVHRAFRGSSRTLCGCRIACALKSLRGATEPCQGCGFAPETDIATVAEMYGIPK